MPHVNACSKKSTHRIRLGLGLCIAAFALPCLVLSPGCAKQPGTPTQQPDRSLTVYTSIAPHYFAARQLLGEHDRIINICPVGEDAAEYMPERSVLNDLVKSDVIIVNGATFEQWLPRVSLPDSKLLDVSLSFKTNWLSDEEKLHAHGENEAHSHQGINGHTWLAPHYYKKQCEAIYERLRHILGDDEQEKRSLTDNYARLQEQLTQLDARGRAAFAPLRGATVAATHPTYTYLAEQYGFTLFTIALDPDAREMDATAAKEVERLKREKSRTDIAYLFWERPPGEQLAKAIADLGIWNVVFEPLENMAHPDFIAGMEANFDRMENEIRTR